MAEAIGRGRGGRQCRAAMGWAVAVTVALAVFGSARFAAGEPGTSVVLNEAITAQTAVARMQVDKKPFNDKRVRQAVRLCLDHQKLLDIAYRGRGALSEDHAGEFFGVGVDVALARCRKAVTKDSCSGEARPA